MRYIVHATAEFSIAEGAEMVSLCNYCSRNDAECWVPEMDGTPMNIRVTEQ